MFILFYPFRGASEMENASIAACAAPGVLIEQLAILQGREK